MRIQASRSLVTFCSLRICTEVSAEFWKRLEKVARPDFDWNRVVRKDPCTYCGRHKPRAEMTTEHVMPLSKGGANIPENKVGACATCNRRRGSMPLISFLLTRRWYGRTKSD